MDWQQQPNVLIWNEFLAIITEHSISLSKLQQTRTTRDATACRQH